MRQRLAKKDLQKVINALKIQDSKRYELDEQQQQNKEQHIHSPFKLLKQNNNRVSKTGNHPISNLMKYNRINSQATQSRKPIFKKERSFQLRKNRVLKRSQEKIHHSKELERSPYMKNARYSLNLRQGAFRQSVSKQFKPNEQIKSRTKTFINPNASYQTKYETIGQSQPNQQIKRCQQARKLFSQGQYSKSLQLLDQILLFKPNDIQASYLCCLNWVNLHEYKKSIKILNKIIQTEPNYNRTMYILAAICQNKLLIPNAGKLKLLKCIKIYPDYYEAYMYLGKIQHKNQKYQEATKYFEIASKLKPHKIQPIINSAQCKFQDKKYMDSLSEFERVEKIIKDKPDQHYRYNYLYEKMAVLQISYLSLYTAGIESIRKLLKNTNSTPHILFLLAEAYFKKHDYQQSLMVLQQILKLQDDEYISKSLCMMIVIYIKQDDFYQACHLIERTKNIGVDQRQIEAYKFFCEGAICLMKRKFAEGIQFLQNIRDRVLTEKRDNQMFNYIRNIFHMYTSYGYFCEGNFKQAKQQLRKQNKYPIDSKNKQGVLYNMQICEGILEFQNNKYLKALENFKKASKIYPYKPEPYLYEIICLSKLDTLKLQSKQYIINLLNQCCILVKDMSNNCGANIYYHRAIYNCMIREWSLALSDIDQAIERSQENYWKYFYARGLIMACCQSFKAAINQISIAISLNQGQAKLYLLRSKCLQIEGDGNQAFADLQTYIALKPNDSSIHKYAGHLLFENGAFEDALVAYSNGKVEQTAQNFDVFLTRGKTYFLLGQFEKASQDMLTAHKLKKQLKQLKFDQQMMLFCSKIKVIYQQFERVTEQKRQAYLDDEKNKEKWIKLGKQLKQLYNHRDTYKYGKIFKYIQNHVFQGTCQFFAGKIENAINNFVEAIKLKELTFKVNEAQDQLESHEDFQEQDNEKIIFINQMYFNIAICYQMLNDFITADSMLAKCVINTQTNIYQKFSNYRLIVLGSNNNKNQYEPYEIFSLNNKLSKYLPIRKVPIPHNKYILIKLCIPFPKVQPPQIFPEFDQELYQKFTVLKVEKKPEAPWITRQNNNIKFTEKIEVYSRLQLDQSEKASKCQPRNLHNQQQNSYIGKDFGEQFEESMICIKQKLRLDSNVQQKLNKLMKKQAQNTLEF